MIIASTSEIEMYFCRFAIVPDPQSIHRLKPSCRRR
jgi:hypothetical protein